MLNNVKDGICVDKKAIIDEVEEKDEYRKDIVKIKKSKDVSQVDKKKLFDEFRAYALQVGYKHVF